MTDGFIESFHKCSSVNSFCHFDERFIQGNVSVTFKYLELNILRPNCDNRYLSRKTGRGIVSPFVEVEICGADYDNAKFKTKTISDNGFNPVWDECFDFTVKNPDLAMIRFACLK